ncbi:hypothetical protein T552_01585 [Pneumocystis carinii B80]|uniref:Uncharacterized protein n=1 Tax=Pneumocystis carinii (strain B80) TaxID=1408658 RepID=A0A0W4ZKQ9_PNEC8|nr:hypothetical protein T552_01585 [Pneumocystis carinii B80]KTW28955.1 hypothetical protein T552_01585 [Pneumocystis carinii B80]
MSENLNTEVQEKRKRKRNHLSSIQARELEKLMRRPDREIDISAPLKPPLPPPPDIVNNVQGSSAGASSGEFHIYKVSRRREYERIKMQEEETKYEINEREFNMAREAITKKDEEKTAKNRARRQKRKQNKINKIKNIAENMTLNCYKD